MPQVLPMGGLDFWVRSELLIRGEDRDFKSIAEACHLEMRTRYKNNNLHSSLLSK